MQTDVDTGASNTATAPRFKGTPIELGGTTYVVPPLALGKVKELLPRIQDLRSFTGLASTDDLDTMIAVVHSAIARNYPDFTEEQLLEVLDLGNLAALFRSVMGIADVAKKDDASRDTPAIRNL